MRLISIFVLFKCFFVRNIIIYVHIKLEEQIASLKRINIKSGKL